MAPRAMIRAKLTILARLSDKFSGNTRQKTNPEIKAKTEDELFMALCAKKEMECLVMQKSIILKNVSTEKYGRLLADVYVGNLHVNEHMLKNRLAVPYDGKTKKYPTNWKTYHHNGILDFSF